MTALELCQVAKQAMTAAYTPYSGYTVGAALLTADGRVYTGCNIENAAYTPTVCAERVAIFKAVSDGNRDFAMLAVAGGPDGVVTGEGASPCGVCRQVMVEFCPPDFPVLVAGVGDTYRRFTLAELLPAAFGPKNLTK